MKTKMKKSTIILMGAFFVFFMIGYIIGIEREKQTLINICSENLEIDSSEIKSVKYEGKTLIINLKNNMEERVSSEDKTIYEIFDPELVLNLKDAVKKENICIQ